MEFVQGHTRIGEVQESKSWTDLKCLVVVYRFGVERPICEGDVMGEDCVHIPEERDTEDHIASTSRGQNIVGSLNSTNARLGGYALANGKIEGVKGDGHAVYRNGHVEGGFAWDVV